MAQLAEYWYETGKVEVVQSDSVIRTSSPVFGGTRSVPRYRSRCLYCPGPLEFQSRDRSGSRLASSAVCVCRVLKTVPLSGTRTMSTHTSSNRQTAGSAVNQSLTNAHRIPMPQQANTTFGSQSNIPYRMPMWSLEGRQVQPGSSYPAARAPRNHSSPRRVSINAGPT